VSRTAPRQGGDGDEPTAVIELAPAKTEGADGKSTKQ